MFIDRGEFLPTFDDAYFYPKREVIDEQYG
jgi:hypothetical protein